MRGLTWVVRPRPDADALSSAWLIRRFVDPEARFEFSDEREGILAGCTFEGLCDVYRLHSAPIARLARIVRDLDCTDGRAGAPEAAALGHLVSDLCVAHESDDVLLALGMVVFEALYLECEVTEANGDQARRSEMSPWSNG